MSSESSNIRHLHRYTIKEIIQYFAKTSDGLSNRYVFTFDSFENIVSMFQELNKMIKDSYALSELYSKIGDSSLNVSALDPYKVLDDSGNVEYEAFQIEISNSIGTKRIVFIPDCDERMVELGDAYKNYIRNYFVDRNENAILFFLSVQNVASVAKTVDDFQKQGMPLSVANVYENLKAQISIIAGENAQKTVLYALNTIMRNKPQYDMSLTEFAPIIRIIESQTLMPTDFHDLHMFQMPLTDLGKKDQKLAENYKLFHDISLALSDHEIESFMSDYEPTIVKELQRAFEEDEENWDSKIGYEHIQKYKKVNQKRFKLDAPILVTDENDNEISHEFYLDFVKSTSAAFVISTKDLPGTKIVKIALRFTQKATAQSDEFLVEQANTRGTYYKIVVCVTDFLKQGKVVFTGGKNNAFTVVISATDTVASFWSQSCNGLSEKKDVYTYQLIAKDNIATLGINDTRVEKNFSTNEVLPISIDPRIQTDIHFIPTDGEVIKSCNLSLDIDVSPSPINVSVKFAESERRMIALWELFNKCILDKNSYCISEGTIYNKHVLSDKYDEMSSFTVAGKSYELTALFAVEQKVVSERLLFAHMAGMHNLEGYSLEVPADISEIYNAICDYFEKNYTIPSLSTINDELKGIYTRYIKCVLGHISEHSDEFVDKQSIETSIINILKIGTIEDMDGFIWLTPLSPLSVAYQLHLVKKENHWVKLDEYLYGNLGFGNLLPFIFDKHSNVLQAVKGDYPLQWACYYDSSESIKGEVSTYASKIEDYYVKFNYLYERIPNSTFLINVIGIRHTSEIVKALLKLYKASPKINPRDFYMEINYYYRGTGENEFDNLIDPDFTYEYALKYYGVKNVELAEGFRDWYEEHVRYYSNLDSGSYKYAHITFCAIQTEKGETLSSSIRNAKSGIMLEGLIADIPSSLDSNSCKYKYGFGAQYSDELISNSELLQLAYALNELALCKPGSPASRSISIAQGVQNTKSERLESIYKASNWVVFVEPKIDLDFFIEQSNEKNDELIIIHYPDKNVSSNGYKSITVTQKSEQYIDVIREYLSMHLPLFEKEFDVKTIIKNFNAYSGEWLMNFINNKQIEEKVSLVSAISFCREYFKRTYPEYVWVPVALDEVLRVTGSIGGTMTDVLFSKKVLIKRGIIDSQSSTSDDLLFAGVKIDGEMTFVKYIPIEVKHGTCGPDIRRDAHAQVCNTGELILLSFKDIEEEEEKSVRIDKKLYRNYMMQHVISNVEKMLAYKIVDGSSEYASLISSETRTRLLNDEYILEAEKELETYAFYFVEGATAIGKAQNGKDSVIEISVPMEYMYSILADNSVAISEAATLDGLGMASDSTDYNIVINSFDEFDDEDSDTGDSVSDGLADELIEISGFFEGDSLAEVSKNDVQNIETPIATYQNEDHASAKTKYTVDDAEINQLIKDFTRACSLRKIEIDELDKEKVVVGPGIIRIKFKLKRGQSLDTLRNQLEDIGREMKRSNLLVQQLPNSDEIVLDIPRLTRDQVLFKDVIGMIPDNTSLEEMWIPVGRTPEGEDICTNLSEIPHLLIGGSTGSGKTVLLFTMLAAILKQHKGKDDIKLLLSSAGIEDFIHFAGLPQLIGGKVFSSAKETVDAIMTVVAQEFEARATIIAEARVTNIIEYNKKSETKLAPILVVIDEFADISDQLKKQEKEDFFTVVRRIVQIGRKRGIHLVLCTQRPSANLVPTDIKAQLNGRIALRVNDGQSSRMILDEGGAQDLQKYGDMYFRYNNEKKRAQGYYISIDELDEIVNEVISFNS